ncbi:MAG TPA: sigma 54-interacting transcriptional regulator [Burkholderiales bacterium]|nr:sigma 54-interacting transcriptional regulator [Burkholderiales bacterium]
MEYIKCMSSPRLTAADRDFFTILARVVFGNPFSRERAADIAHLVPDATPGDLISDREALARVVGPRLETRLGGGCASIQAFGAEDRALLEPALLYVCYHRYVAQLDALIESQVAHESKSPIVKFADDAMAELVRDGISEERAARYFAFYFQLRRAFYFIHRGLAGECPSMQRLRKSLWNNIFTHDMRGFEAALWNRMEDFSTLLLGETGTGKGSAAAAIGRSGFIPYLPGQRRFATSFTESFIAINLSQYPESLIESELFGHRKGAFTGAIESHDGVFARCSPHGSLFLDEIGEVSMPIQTKLLQVLQERTFTPIGGHEKSKFAGRVIAATNQPLDRMRREGRFREDFYYRLCSDVIEMPTLRQRLDESPGELEQLVDLLVTRIAGEPASGLVASVMEAVDRDIPRDYAWPGNVRELEQAVRRILLTGHYATETPHSPESEVEKLVSSMQVGELTSEDLLRYYGALLYRRFGKVTEVARRMAVDPRTARKYVEGAGSD